MQANTWHLQLCGRPSDLAHLAENLALPQLSVMVDARDGSHALYSDEFLDAPDSASVLKRAVPVMAVLNGLLRIARPTSDPVTGGAVYRTNANGGRDVFVHVASAVLRVEAGTVSVVVTDKDGNVVPPPPPPLSRTQLLGRLAVTDPVVAKAMRLIASPDARTWVGMYRLYEIIEDAIGSQSALVETGWASRSDIKRFKHSANSVAIAGDSARHGKETEVPPRNPMTLDEGSEFVGYVTQAWLAAKGA